MDKLISTKISKDLETNKHEFLPSKIGQKGDVVKRYDLGITDYLLDKENTGFTVKFTIFNTDDYEGTVTIDVLIYKGSSKKISALKVITGYMTLQKLYQEEVDNLKKICTTEQNTSKNNQLPEWKKGELVTSLDLGIFEPLHQKNVDFVYKVDGNDELQGILNVDVQIIKTLIKPKKNQSDEKINLSSSFKMKINGFKTRASQDRDDVELFKLHLQNFETTKKTTLPSLIGLGEKRVTDLGIEILPNKNVNKIIIEKWEVKAIDDINGTIVFEASLKKGEFKSTVQGIISQFMTIAQQDELEITAIINKINQLKTANTELLPVWKIDEFVTAKELGIFEAKNNKTKITYKVINVNQFAGEVTIDVIVTKGSLTKTKSNVKVMGFMTLRKQYQLDVKKVLLNIRNQRTSNINFLPSEITSDLNTKTLGIDEVIDDYGSVITYKKADNAINNDLGTLLIKVTVTKILKATFMTAYKADEYKGEDQKHQEENDIIIFEEKNILISNFKTTTRKNQEDVQKVIDKIVDTSTTFSSKTSISIEKENVTPEKLGISEIKDKFDTIITYTNLATDYEKGEIKVKIDVKKGQSLQQKVITISGYKTKDQQDEDDIDEIELAIPKTVFTSHRDKLSQEI